METTGRVRPEFALSWRKNFQKATLQKQRRVLNRLRRLLRAPYSGQGANFFTDRVLKADIWRFDEACYQSYWVHLRRQVLASCVSVFFILLACGATFGSLAINDEFELNPWVAYVLSGDLGQEIGCVASLLLGNAGKILAVVRRIRILVHVVIIFRGWVRVQACLWSLFKPCSAISSVYSVAYVGHPTSAHRSSQQEA